MAIVLKPADSFLLPIHPEHFLFVTGWRVAILHGVNQRVVNEDLQDLLVLILWILTVLEFDVVRQSWRRVHLNLPSGLDRTYHRLHKGSNIVPDSPANGIFSSWKRATLLKSRGRQSW